MMEMVVFAVVLGVVLSMTNFVVGVLAMKFYMSKKNLKKYTKMSLEIANELQEEMDF